MSSCQRARILAIFVVELVLRALRILRVLRLVALVPSMRGVLSALLIAVPGMVSIAALPGLISTSLW